MGNPDLEQRARSYVGQEVGPPEVGADLVNEAMIRHWCDAMGDRNPVYLDADAAAKSVHGGLVAPPTMLQAWILAGMPMAEPAAAPADRQRELHRLFDEHGYTGVVATNCEQLYHRYLRPGDRVSAHTVIESVSEEKATALGVGYFIETRTTFTDEAGDEVGSMMFRVLKFKPAREQQPAAGGGAAPARPGRLRPPLGHDNAWWWEAIERGELLIQKCSDCAALRHPPRPRCHACQSDRWEGVATRGIGTVHSYVVLHHPPVPGYELPLPIGLVDLEEGVRLVSNIVDCELEEIYIGMPVEAFIDEVEEGFKLPLFRPSQ